jgi:hypothetical protein
VNDVDAVLVGCNSVLWAIIIVVVTWCITYDVGEKFIEGYAQARACRERERQLTYKNGSNKKW